MRIQPASGAELSARRQHVDMDQRFQPFEREFDLPPQPAGGEYRLGRVALGRQRGSKDQELRGDQALWIQRLLLAARLGAQRLAGGLCSLGRLAQNDEADRHRHPMADRGSDLDLVRHLIVRQGLEVIDQVKRRAILAGQMKAVPLHPHDQVGLAAAVLEKPVPRLGAAVEPVGEAHLARYRRAAGQRFGALGIGQLQVREAA